MGQQTSLVVEVEIEAPVEVVRSLRDDPDVFEWGGGWWPLLMGQHEFTWRASTKTPGATTFTRIESLRGLLVLLWQPGWFMRRRTQVCFDAFHSELKKEAERIVIAYR
ncbi:uncharacterized protein BKA55DRAFT_542776 [Fusarium redolens]|uniref:Uncharacterized protein n=1 Tax=Fusarium redolens TaxID=48865 RepID=A0A9P9GJC4_FUSRE|nr:uncharacterized protein BKA55DRAFT_542776 [Fusarium redolens]KAH7240181.1 hypothetical protein BKA55DRAFT_542776 [Fusarium redolens]